MQEKTIKKKDKFAVIETDEANKITQEFDFIKSAEESTKKITVSEKTKLKFYADQILAFDAGGKIKKDVELGGIARQKSVNDFEYEQGQPLFDGLIAFLGKTPPLKLLYDVISYYYKERSKILKEIIPKLLQQFQLSECVLDNGHKIALETDLQIQVVNQDKFFSWLRKEGYQDYIKTTLTVSDDDFNSEVKEILDNSEISYQSKSGIHWQSQKKIISDRLKSKQALPTEKILAVTQEERAVIK